ncbi:hypothetical protein Tsubulata_050613 [Turnera subulata]|uniref:CCHC-type domain-containing protein n=1 Tax=Turnera subulata TaxID=218843 RepID=A0A9Q0G865_9ROSI|nr:hypothetical protein Tsubulata_050613 [Turnera subulata]
MLCSRLQRLWGLHGGPWVVLDHYLTVEPWQPNFDPASHRVTSVVAWIRVPGLSTELFQLAILKEIGNRIGRFLRVDYSTQKTERGRFAKAAVDLDLSKPLQTEACVDGIWYTIKYENLPNVCFECGRAGHDMSHCPSRLSGVSSPTGPVPGDVSMDTEGPAVKGSHDRMSKGAVPPRLQNMASGCLFHQGSGLRLRSRFSPSSRVLRIVARARLVAPGSELLRRLMTSRLGKCFLQ